VATNSFLRAAALRAARKRRDGLVDDETFRRNLVDMFLGALSMSTRISPNPPMCDSTSTRLVWSA
jgi:hypothetical protein